MNGRTVKLKLRRLADRTLVPALFVSLLIAISLWLVFQHRPSWYRPPELGRADLQRARVSAVNTADSVSDMMVSHATFEVVLEDCIVNRWLAALPTAWPEALERVPPEITEPAVRFDDGVMFIGVHVARGAWRAIASVSLRLGVSDDGTSIELTLLGVQGGSLSVPRSLLASWLDPELMRVSVSGVKLRDAGGAGPAGNTSLGSMLQNAASANGEPGADANSAIARYGLSVDDLFQGLSLRNRFTWFNGKRPFRIDAIRIEQGKLHVSIEPL